MLLNFNPRAPCGARLGFQASDALNAIISIHAPRAGRDPASRPPPGRTTENFNPRAPCGARRRHPAGHPHRVSISIHAPRAGRDTVNAYNLSANTRFQSTRPVRGATRRKRRCNSLPQDFNPRAPCGARQNIGRTSYLRLPISIHAPRAGRDASFGLSGSARSTNISIHAPRAGRDSKSIQNYFTHFCDKRQFLDNFTQNAAF